MTVTVGGVALNNVVDFEFGESKEVSKPEYISQTFKTDTNVWNKSCIEIAYILYASNYIKNELKKQLENHVLIDVYDDIYQINTSNAFLTKMSSSWVGDKDWEHPWQIALTIFIMEEIDDSSFDFEAGTRIFYEDFEDFNTNGWTIHTNDLSTCETAGSQNNQAEGWIEYGAIAHWYMYFKPLEGTYARRFKMSGKNSSGATTVTATTATGGCTYYGDAPWLDVTVDGGGAIVHNDANYLTVAAYHHIECKLDTLENYADECDAYHVSSATLHIRGRTSAEGNLNNWNRLYVTLFSRSGASCYYDVGMGYTPRFTVESGWEEITLDVSSFYQSCGSLISNTCIEFGNINPIYEKFYGALSSVWITFQCSSSGSAYLEKDLVTRGTNYYNALTYDMRFFVYDSIGANGWLLYGKGDDGTNVFWAWLDSSGYIHIDYYAGVGGSQTIKCDSIANKTINWNRWNWLRIYYNCDYTAGAIKIWLNGTLIYDYTGATIDYDGIGLETILLGLMYAGWLTWWDTGIQDLFVDKVAIYEPYEEELSALYSIDARLIRRYFAPYLTDIILKKIATQTYPTDVLTKILDSEKTYSIDAYLRGKDMDLYYIDTEFVKRLTTGYAVDVILFGWTIENITNGGFESHFDNWTYGSTAYIDHTKHHSGDHSASGGYDDVWINQDIEALKGSPIAVSSIGSFDFWAYSDYTGGSNSQITVEITYSDTTTMTHTWTSLPYGTWTQCHILPYLDPTKSVSKIKFIGLSWDNVIYLDDVTLMT